MDNWDEIRTAYQVARLGTVSGAAEVLGVHHATVIRHVDALEERLGVKLFQRHARGYTATEAGSDLMQVAAATDDQFAQLAGRIKGRGQGIGGELVVTSLVGLSPLITPVLADFQRAHDGVTIRYLTGDRLFRLEYGEAHVAIRAGTAPQQPDNVVQPFARLRMSLVAADAYVARYGLPADEADLVNHWFVGHDNSESRAPFNRWLLARVPRERMTFRTMDNGSLQDAVIAGAGIGFLPLHERHGRDDLHDALPMKEDWTVPLWLVTHVDLHRSPKVQAFLSLLKDRARDWIC
ncbi:MAG: LysR family transcriptional regulator [Rubellimicrobium sp.]|nr:LysR family transcriptional regulator [Rubellimicrobium sp.]